MSAIQRIASIVSRVSRLRYPVAGLLGIAALLCIWTGLGLSSRLSLQGAAMAGGGAQNNRAAALAVVPEDRAGLLQSTVDSVALSLGGALAAEAEETARRAALSGALSALTFNLGGEVYFTAWQGTRIVHSPGSPDAEGLDFSGALDHRGAPFVQGMEDLALKEGGFVRALLPRQMAAQPAPPLADAAPADAIFPDRVLVCPMHNDSARSCVPGRLSSSAPPQQPVEQVVYVRRIPDSPWHIAAFMPADPVHVLGEDQAFSRLWPASGHLSAALAAEGRFRRGLCVSGFSLAGLAGLMLIPAGRGQAREEEASESAQA